MYYNLGQLKTQETNDLCNGWEWEIMNSGQIVNFHRSILLKIYSVLNQTKEENMY